MDASSENTTWVILPTYEEKENILWIYEGIRKVLPGAWILFVDDSSPDGTQDEIKKLMARDDKVRALFRPVEKKGRGWAGRDGFLEALRQGARYVVEMDADGSHDPMFLPKLLAPLWSQKADMVLGSRYVSGGTDEERSRLRRWISGFARTYLKFVLGIRVKDPTSGYRAYSREALEKLEPEKLRSRDPFIVTEILYLAHRKNLHIMEVPIRFHERRKGSSKLGGGVLMRYLVRVWKLKKGKIE